LKEVKPEGVFGLFLTDSLLETIATHTNEYTAASVAKSSLPVAGLGEMLRQKK
jgi:hypothetical protein